jgi:protein farnesyltransferase subunit beta
MPRITNKKSKAVAGKSQSLVKTETTELQEDTELECEPFYVNLRSLTASQVDHLRQVGLLLSSSSRNSSSSISHNAPNDNEEEDSRELWEICLLYHRHATYLHRVFETSTTPLAASFLSLDASHPWMIYWCLQGCDLLLVDPQQQQQQQQQNTSEQQDSLLPPNVLDVVHYLERCWQTTTVYLDSHVIQQDSILTAIAPPPAATNSETTTAASSSTSGSNRIAMTGGGFGGGPGQMPHCATTYASILSLCIIATTTHNTTTASSSAAAWQLLEIIRLPLYVWLVALQQQQQGGCFGGGVAMHMDGEVDVRAAYIALCVTKLLGLLSPASILLHTTPSLLDFCASCQTYEGGFGSEPGSEAHSGYTFCAMAAIQFLLEIMEPEQQQTPPQPSSSLILSKIQVTSLRDWLARRQMSYEGGFSGRTNKLVDGCYSFWQGGSICILEHWLSLQQQQQQQQQTTAPCIRDEAYDPWLLSSSSSLSQPNQTSSTATITDRSLLLMDQAMLQRYILLCCQDAHGGLRDKPSKARDFYHSCYVLSGLSASRGQYPTLQSQECQEEHATVASLSASDDQKEEGPQIMMVGSESGATEPATTKSTFGHSIYSRVHATHPCFNIRIERVRQVLQHFHQMPVMSSFDQPQP